MEMEIEKERRCIIIDRYYINTSLKNGLGNPSVDLYLTGCDKPVKCEDCHNPELQKISTDYWSITELENELDDYIKKFLEFNNRLFVSLLGGEPLTEENQHITYTVSKYVKQNYKDVTTVLYSWRTIEKIKEEKLNCLLKYIDYGVLGPYKKELYQDNIIPSSKNQYIYDFNNNKKIKPIKLYIPKG